MTNNFVRYTLRVDRGLFQKFRFVAEYKGRSANRELEQMMKQQVRRFESEHGPIELTGGDA